MLVIIDERQVVLSAYASGFGEAGVCTTNFSPSDFGEWVGAATGDDFEAVEGFVIGNCSEQNNFPTMIRKRSRAPVIALSEYQLRIPMKPAIDSETKPATCSDFIPASIPI